MFSDLYNGRARVCGPHVTALSRDVMAPSIHETDGPSSPLDNASITAIRWIGLKQIGARWSIDE